MSEENEVSLVMERDDAPSVRLHRCRKDRAQHPRAEFAEVRGEMLENDLGVVAADFRVPGDVARQRQRRQAVARARAVREVQVHQRVHLVLRLNEHEKVCVFLGLCLFDDVCEGGPRIAAFEKRMRNRLLKDLAERNQRVFVVAGRGDFDFWLDRA